ncbi:MAG: phosphoribosyl-ATP diphosphatase [Myxococcota bacterium]|nr:phosphoribosyl-ATP diphosphatase [Myxococcota bacterium]
MAESEILERLFQTIETRRLERPDGSYVVSLLDGGLEAIAAKIREEAEETIEAAGAGDADHCAQEVADLLFHVWVLLCSAGLKPVDVYAVLEDRFGVGGLTEKAARRVPDGE